MDTGEDRLYDGYRTISNAKRKPLISYAPADVYSSLCSLNQKTIAKCWDTCLSDGAVKKDTFTTAIERLYLILEGLSANREQGGAARKQLMLGRCLASTKGFPSTEHCRLFAEGR